MFDDIIKNKADEHEAPVPPDAWDNIVQQKKKRRIAIWWWGGSLLLLLASLLTAGYFISNNQKQNDSNTVTASKPVEEKNKIVNPALSEPAAKQSQATDEKEKGNIIPGIDDSKVAVDKNENTHSTGIKTNAEAGKELDKNNKAKIVSANRVTKKDKGRLQSKQLNPGLEEINNNDEKENVAVENNVAEKNEVSKATKEPAAEQQKDSSIATDKNILAGIETKDATPQQTEKKENKTLTKQTNKHSWFIDAGIAPLLTSSQYDENIAFNRTLFSNNNLAVYNASLLKTTIEPAVAFSLAVRRELSKKFTVGTGLQYLLLKENISIEGKEINTAYTVVNRLVNGALIADTVETVTEGTRNINAVNSYHLFSIPVFMQYNIIKKPKWNLSAVGGMYINISSSYQNEINRNATAQLIVTPAAGNKTNTGLDVFAGIRIGKTLGRRFDFFAMPSMRWSLGKYNIKNSLLNKNINQAGVQFGVSYKIN